MAVTSTIRFVTRHPLNRDRPVQALARFVRFQLASRLAGAPIVHPWVGGSRILVTRGQQGLTANVYAGLHEFSDMGFLLHYLRPVDTFVDVGANRGSYTVLAAVVAGSDCIAFEPDTNAFAGLTDNIRLNNVEDRVELRKVALAGESGIAQFTADGDALNRALLEGERSTASVQAVTTTTLDQALADQSVALLKIDVEGMEPAVLDGAEQTLANPALKAAIIEMNGFAERYGRDSGEILPRMRKFGFTPSAYDPATRSIVPSDVANEWGNLLFVRDIDWVLARVREAAPVVVNGREV